MIWAYLNLSHAIENTANQKARKPFDILWYATGSIPWKNHGVPRGLQIFPAERSIEEPATDQNFHSEKITVNNQNMEEENPSFDLNFEFLEPDID